MSTAALHNGPSCGCCGTSPPPPVPVVCSGTTHDIPATLNLTVPAHGAPLGSQYCGDACFYQISESTYTNGCCYTGGDPSGSFAYGPPPSGTESAFTTGYEAWFCPTLYQGAANAAAGCGPAVQFYQYISYSNSTPGVCVFTLRYIQNTGAGWSTTSAVLGGAINANGFSWTMGGSNTWSPFLATDTVGSCVATLSG